MTMESSKNNDPITNPFPHDRLVVTVIQADGTTHEAKYAFADGEPFTASDPEFAFRYVAFNMIDEVWRRWHSS